MNISQFFFSQTNLESLQEVWTNILWTDETEVELISVVKLKAFYRATLKHSGGSMMMWG